MNVLTVLVFHLCLATGGECQEERIVWEGTPLQCSLFAQQAIAQRLRGRPELVMVGKHRCVTSPSGGENVG